MLQRIALAVLVSAFMLERAPAAAYVVVPNQRVAIERGVQRAMRCPDMVPGNYVVEINVTGLHVSARVITSPRISVETERCIALAFERQRFSNTRRTERIEAPFGLMDGMP